MATSCHMPLCLRTASHMENETSVSPYHQRKAQNSFFFGARCLYRCSSQHIWTRSFLSFEEKRWRRKLCSNSGKVSCSFPYGTELVTACSWNELVLCSDVPVVVEFWASWCGPCKMVSRLVDEMACEYSGRIRCLRIDVDKYPQIAASHGVERIPTVLVFNNAVKLQSITGTLPKSVYITAIQKSLSQ